MVIASLSRHQDSIIIIVNIAFIVAVDRRPDRLDAFAEVEPWVLSIVDRIVWIHYEG